MYKIHIGGKRYYSENDPQLNEGYFVEPTIFEIDNEDSDLQIIKRILDNSMQIKMSQNRKNEE